LGVSKSSVSYWVRDISLSKKALLRIQNKLTAGQKAAVEAKRRQTQEKWQRSYQWAQNILKETSQTDNTKLLICAVVFWCEGTKKPTQGLNFTNSDPNLIRYFLELIRECFSVDESKFRVSLHLHNYHNKENAIKFWSEVTKIPEDQFLKPYQKPNTSKRYRDGYQGCVNIRYFDTNLGRKLLALGELITKQKT